MKPPANEREFAVQVVRTLRDAGHQALWAGGCVRDRLLGVAPKDYDVATSATPDEVREVFGRKRTLAIGASFGVITVLGPKPAGQIEVATFRADGEYQDGRRPGGVTFTDAAEDARRRDFTINGLFYDPIDDEVIDYVGGRDDLDQQLIRAIGDPEERFAEDKLRMLRAVRFAATLGFEIDAATASAIRGHAAELTVVSAERIGAELRRVLTNAGRARGLRLLRELELLKHTLPEVAMIDDEGLQAFEAVSGRLSASSLPVAVACLLQPHADSRAVAARCAALKFTRKEGERSAWLVENLAGVRGAAGRAWSATQPLLANDGGRDLVDAYEALNGADDDSRFCRAKLALPADELNPPPLVTGDSLVRAGLRPGPEFASLLKLARDAQLDGEIDSAEQAISLITRHRAAGEG